MKYRIILLITILIISSGCATPNLSKYAEASKELKQSVNDIEQEVLGKINYVSDALDTGKEIGFVQADKDTRNRWELISISDAKRFKKNQKDYITNIATINATMAAMVQYSEAIASLAEAGETGSDASKQLIDSTNSIFKTLTITVPGGSVISDGVANALSEVAQIFTRIQAQDTLAETLSSAQPAVESLSELLIKQTDNLRKLTNTLTRIERQLILATHGPAKMSYYRQFSSYPSMDNLYADMGECALNHKDDLEAVWNCHVTKEKSISSRLDTLARISEEYNDYLAKKLNTRKWTKQQQQKLSAIALSAKAWANTHKNASTLLKNCGGLRALRNDCGNLTVTNLKSSVDWLKGIKEGFDVSDVPE